MNNITLGKYVPYNSFIHRLDPRSKLLSMILLMVCIFFKFSSDEHTPVEDEEPKKSTSSASTSEGIFLIESFFIEKFFKIHL